MVRQSLANPRSAWRGALAGLGAGLLCAGVFAAGWLAGPYDALQDALYPAPPPSSQVTLIAVDDATSQLPLAGGEGYPWSNAVHAQVLRKLAALHPKAILFDILLDRHTDAAGDLDLERAIDEAAQQTRVVIICSGVHQPQADFARPAVVVADRGFGLPDAAGNVRGIATRPSRPCAENASGESAVLAALGDSAASVPTDRGQLLVNFTSAGRAVTCPYRVAFESGCPAGLVTGKVVVVGLKLVTGDDIHSQPVAFPHDPTFCPAGESPCMRDNQNYGYRISADAIATVLDHRFIGVEPGWLVALVAVAIATMLGAGLYLLPFRVGALAALCVTAAAIAAAVIAGHSGRLADPLFLPAACVLAGLGALAVRYLVEERERRKVEALFGQYVDESVARRLVAVRSLDEVRLGGRRRTVSVLFADVRDFTTLAEELEPEEVMALLNDFTGRATDIVAAHGGTLDKYIGDAVMAYWNAPDDCADHADRAVRAGMEMIRSAAGALRSRGVQIGVGVCSGDVVVGNVGGRRRRSYTAIGDVVNTASRLCGAAPGGTLLVADSTWAMLGDRPPAERLEPMSVKGRRETVGVHAVHVAGAVASTP